MTDKDRHDESSDRQDVSESRQAAVEDRQDEAEDREGEAYTRVSDLDDRLAETRRLGLERMQTVVGEISGLRADTQEQIRKVEERRGRERILNVLMFIILIVVLVTAFIMHDSFKKARAAELEQQRKGAAFMVDFIACDQGNAEQHRLNTYNHQQIMHPDAESPAPAPRQTVKLTEQELYAACKRLADGIYFQVEGE